eukprot:1917527-Pyramimonas_sp.AAC.1
MHDDRHQRFAADYPGMEKSAPTQSRTASSRLIMIIQVPAASRHASYTECLAPSVPPSRQNIGNDTTRYSA